MSLLAFAFLMAKTVVILGAGWAGLPLAHKLLKYTVPKILDLKIILVSPNSHFFWNIATTRGIIPEEIADDDLFIPIAPAFQHYSPNNFEFKLGSARMVRVDVQTVTVEMLDGSTETLTFDELVIATGSRLRGDVPLKVIGSHGANLDAWHALQAKVGVAETIVVSGGGPTGVEVAGELAAKYGNTKKIKLITSGSDLVATATPSVRQTIAKDLAKLEVEIIYRTTITDVQSDDISGIVSLTTAEHKTIKANLYLPFHGVQVNTSFMPDAYLDDKANLKLDASLRVTGTTSIWGIGDVGNVEPKQLTVTDNQIIHLASALDATLTGVRVKEYEPLNKTMIFVSLGRRFGTGQIGGWRLWGFMVNYVKGRRLFVDTAKGYVGGKHLRHAAM